MQKWLPWEIVSNHLGQEMKHHKSILYDDLVHLSIENMKYCIFKISKYMLLCKMVAMVILHPFLSSGHIMPIVAKQESYSRRFICI